MRFKQGFFRIGFLMVAALLIVPCASAWTFGSWSDTTRQAALPPGSPVNISYVISFNSYDTGTTFESDDTLVMNTDLADPRWVVTMTETLDDETLQTSSLTASRSMTVRLDGWSLSFSRKQFTVNVRLDGTIPARNQSQEITLVRLRELDPNAELVTGTQVKKVAQVSIPTPEPTAEPTVIVEETVLVITPEPTTADATIVPTKKQTYSPGPDPVLICGLLAGLVLVAGLVKRWK